MPTQHHVHDDEAGPSDAAGGIARRRGLSVSYRDLENSPFALRTSMSNHDRFPGISEEIRPSSKHSKRDAESSRSSQRRRNNDNASRPRASTMTRRPTLGGNAAPSGFTLAGPAEVAPQTNLPYVDPGYAQLNPAYEQPLNTRPVWGLAKPLPRVVRPGMVPTPGEMAPAEPERPVDPDVEKGRVEPTLNLGKISSSLRDTREQRENNFLQRVGTNASSSGATTAPVGRTSSLVSSRRREESNLDAPPQPLPMLTPLPENPASPGVEGIPPDAGRHGGDYFGNFEQHFEQPDVRFPDDVSSAATEIDDDKDWYDEGLDLHPLRTDEIHNHHTHWSVVRTKYREELAELLAVRSQLPRQLLLSLTVPRSSSSSPSASAPTSPP